MEKHILDFKKLPHTEEPFSKRNWGNKLHSVCSYQGKMKPALAYHLINSFSNMGNTVLDPFSGSGTIPLEAALNGRTPIAFDISLLSTVLTNAKIKNYQIIKINKIVQSLENYIKNNNISEKTILDSYNVKYNKTIPEYFHPATFKEVQLARDFFNKELDYEDGSWCLVFASLLHILHGNRPYALSRTSHPITPYAPTGEFIYKNLAEKLKNKIDICLATEKTSLFKEGHCYKQDILGSWPELNFQVDSIITSPPFFDSTKFYITNWMRYWLCGWGIEDFNNNGKSFVETIQIKNFIIYDEIFKKFKEKLKDDGLIVLHLGSSKKFNMAENLIPIAKKYFQVIDSFTESVEKCQKHGISDQGITKRHQYLILRNTKYH